MMKLPGVIKVGCHDYKVLTDDHLAGRASLHGQADHLELTITVDTCLEGSPFDVTFWHEVLHCIDKVYNDQHIDESTIDALAEGLTQVLRDSFDIKLSAESPSQSQTGHS